MGRFPGLPNLARYIMLHTGGDELFEPTPDGTHHSWTDSVMEPDDTDFPSHTIEDADFPR